MSDLAWAVKNGDMDQVKELVEGKVATFYTSIQHNTHEENVLLDITPVKLGSRCQCCNRWTSSPALCK